MEPEIAKTGHVAFTTPDVEASTWFFRDLMGLQEVERTGDAVYLRGLRDWEHHTMSLREGGQAGVEHVAWRTREPAHVRAFGERFEGMGLDVEWLDPGDVRAVGEAVLVQAPGNHPFLFYYDVEKPEPPDGQRSKLRNRRYNPAVGNRVACRRIDHVHVLDPEGLPLADWMGEEMGFGTNERYQSEDGTYRGWWMAATALPHDIGIHRNDHGPSFHHVSYHVDRLRDL